jgi:hypothetical protein
MKKLLMGLAVPVALGILPNVSLALEMPKDLNYECRSIVGIPEETHILGIVFSRANVICNNSATLCPASQAEIWKLDSELPRSESISVTRQENAYSQGDDIVIEMRQGPRIVIHTGLEIIRLPSDGPGAGVFDDADVYERTYDSAGKFTESKTPGSLECKKSGDFKILPNPYAPAVN